MNDVMDAPEMETQLDESRITLNRWLHQARCYGRQDHYLGKRQWTRFEWNTYVQVEVQNLDGSIECVYAQMKDVSVAGIGLIFRQPVDRRAKIRVQLEDENQPGVVSGTVAHCTQTVGNFIVGVLCDHAPTA